MKCETEQQVIKATRNGLWASWLRDHLRGCALCTQTELIAASLQEDVAKVQRGVELPPAGLVWRRAQIRRRERALQRATRRPFLIVGALGTFRNTGHCGMVGVGTRDETLRHCGYHIFCLIKPGDQTGRVPIAASNERVLWASLESSFFLRWWRKKSLA